MLRTPAISFLSVIFSLGVALCGAGCDFDDRTLHPAPVGSAGEGGEGGSSVDPSGISATSSSAGGSSTGESAASSETTTGSGGGTTGTGTGHAPAPSTNVDCPDLDRNSVNDCEETLVHNAGFEASAENWEGQAPVEFAWQAAGSPVEESGSVGVVLGSASDKRTMGGVSQCLEVDAGSRYLVYAQTLIRDEHSAAALSVLFHDTSDCSGAHIDDASSPMLSTSDRWGVLHMIEPTPAGTQSMTVRLAAVKEAAVESVEVRFDNILVRAE